MNRPETWDDVDMYGNVMNWNDPNPYDGRYIDALARAQKERMDAAALSGGGSDIKDYHASDIPFISNSSLIDLCSNTISLLGSFVNHTDIAGDWHQEDDIPLWDLSSMLQYIGDDIYYEPRMEPNAMKELLKQQYKMLNLLRCLPMPRIVVVPYRKIRSYGYYTKNDPDESRANVWRQAASQFPSQPATNVEGNWESRRYGAIGVEEDYYQGDIWYADAVIQNYFIYTTKWALIDKPTKERLVDYEIVRNSYLRTQYGQFGYKRSYYISQQYITKETSPATSSYKIEKTISPDDYGTYFDIDIGVITDGLDYPNIPSMSFPAGERLVHPNNLPNSFIWQFNWNTTVGDNDFPENWHDMSPEDRYDWLMANFPARGLERTQIDKHNVFVRYRYDNTDIWEDFQFKDW